MPQQQLWPQISFWIFFRMFRPLFDKRGQVFTIAANCCCGWGTGVEKQISRKSFGPSLIIMKSEIHGSLLLWEKNIFGTSDGTAVTTEGRVDFYFPQVQ